MSNSQYFEKDGWQLYLTTDGDGHLTVEIKHEDKSEVIEVDEDLLDGTGHYTRRYTTEKIEEDYISEN